jgi:protein-disulfide isomerase
MVTLNRRSFALGASILGGLAWWPGTASAASLGDPSPIGEMALGPENAKVTVIEYASASCPHCANFYKTTFQDLKKEYIDTGKIRFIFREFPHNQPGLAAFMLARCAPKDKYFPIVDMLFEQQDKWLQAPRDELFKIAQLAGFTQESFDACLKNEEVAKGIISVRDQAEGFGVDSIPTFFINGEKLKGETSIEEFRKIIDPLLA